MLGTHGYRRAGCGKRIPKAGSHQLPIEESELEDKVQTTRADTPAHAESTTQPATDPIHLVVDLNRCQAYAQCCFLAPDVFRLHGEEALWYDPSPDPEQWEHVLRAAAVCPVQAITVQGYRGAAPPTSEAPWPHRAAGAEGGASCSATGIAMAPGTPQTPVVGVS